MAKRRQKEQKLSAPPSFRELIGGSVPHEASETSPTFRDMVKDVRPLPEAPQRVGPPPPNRPLTAPVRAPVEPLAVTEHGERYEARATSVNGALVRKLKQGHWPPEAELDVHGLPAADAERRLMAFLRHSFAANLQTLLVVHGRGLHSGPEGPVLPQLVMELLATRSPVPILAVCSAPTRWGGTGAVLVRLRKSGA